MSINFTLVGQAITFLLLIEFTRRFVWPPLIQAMSERQQRIADGLAAAERGSRDLELAKEEADHLLAQTRSEANDIINQATKSGSKIIEQATAHANEQKTRLLGQAQQEIQLERDQAAEGLRDDVAKLIIAGAERILKREIDAEAHRQLIDELISELKAA